MKTIYAVERIDTEYISIAFDEPADAEEWITQNVLPGYRNQWRVKSIKVYKDFAEYKEGTQ